MIIDIITALEVEIAAWDPLRPLTFDRRLQVRRLKRAVRTLRIYAEDEQPGDEYDSDGNRR